MATVLNYFTKITPAKHEQKFQCDRYRKVAPKFNEQHVEKFNVDHKDTFDSTFHRQDSSQPSYLDQIRNKSHEPFRLKRKIKGSLRARLLQFHEDVRPPYWGTWQKDSKKINARKPFGQDDKYFDYEVDSELEWDVGGPGESLQGSSDEGEGEQEDYEIDMSFFVPHGYVSDDEIHQDSDQEGNEIEHMNLDNEDGDTNPDEKKTPRLELKPIMIGPHFNDAPLSNQKHLNFISIFKALYSVKPLVTNATAGMDVTDVVDLEDVVEAKDAVEVNNVVDVDNVVDVKDAVELNNVVDVTVGKDKDDDAR